MAIHYVIYHDGCLDGFSAAFAAYVRFGKYGAEYIPMMNGEDFPMRIVHDDAFIYILDMAFPRAILDSVDKKVSQLRLIDHHVENLVEFKDASYALIQPGLAAGPMSWSFFNGELPALPLYHYVNDADLRLNKMVKSKEYIAGLLSYPYDFDVWKSFISNVSSTPQLIKDGEAILRERGNYIDRLLKYNVLRKKIGNYDNIPIVNTSMYVVDVGYELNKRFNDSPFALTYTIIEDLSVRWNVISNKPDFDAASLASEFGGVGHFDFGGFVTDIEFLRVVLNG